MNSARLIAQRFEIHDSAADLIGRGGMSAVYKGTDRQTGRPVAVKVLDNAKIGDDPTLVERFTREGEALRRLNHPGIVEMVAAVEEVDQVTGSTVHYLVMEYVQGGSLQDLLAKEKRLTVEQTLQIGLDLADALARAHRLGIIHRDLKPGNVLIAEDGTPRLTDFGIAYFGAVTRNLTEAGSLLGTVDYLSPEMCEGQPIDERADIWAFGVLLYVMLTGQRPFAGETAPATIAAILTRPAPDLQKLRPDLPDQLANLIRRMLVKDRERRIPSIRLIGGEIETLLREIQKGDAAPPPAAPLTAAYAAAVRGAAATIAGKLAHRNNLPAETTPFVGREAELAALTEMLQDPYTRLITIMGPGGMGKTRLSLELARQQLEHFDQGVFFIPLAPLQSADSIVPTMGKALEFTFYPGGDPEEQLLDYLRHKNMLLVMDNFEHILDGVGIVSRILQAADGVQVIATSRDRLGLQDEQLFAIQGLVFPEWETAEDAAGYAAVQLFVQSAQRVHSDFQLLKEHLLPLTRICRQLQGMPLAIVMAAAWTKVLTPVEIADELSRSLELLETDLADIPGRQRSLRVVFDYTYKRLTEREQAVFGQLSVFRGGFSRSAAGQIVGASLRELMDLTNKSLMFREPDGRFQIHELLRRYAEENLTNSLIGRGVVRDRHTAYYCAVLNQLEGDLRGSRTQLALRQIEEDIENSRLAWDWAVDNHQLARLSQAVESLGQFYWLQVRAKEGESAFRAAYEMLKKQIAHEIVPSVDKLRLLSRLLVWRSIFNRYMGNGEIAEQLSREALDLLKDPERRGHDVRLEKAMALLQMGRLVYPTGRLEEARRLYNESLALYRQIGNRWGETSVLSSLGWTAISSGAYAEAHQLFQAALRIGRDLGNQLVVASMLVNLGQASLYRGEFERAEKNMLEGLEIFQDIESDEGITQALSRLAETSMLLGKFEESKLSLAEVAARKEDQGHRFGLAYAQVLQCQADLHLGRNDSVMANMPSCRTAFRESNNPWGDAFCHFIEGCTRLAGGDYAAALRSLRESVTINRRIGQRDELSWALAARSYAQRAQAYPAQAEQDVVQALQTGLDIQGVVPLLMAMPAAALLLADRGQKVWALELHALTQIFPFVANSHWFASVAGRELDKVAGTLPEREARMAEAAGRNRDLWASAAELLAKFAESD